MSTPSDPDAVLDRAAKAILATRAPGLGKQQWAKRAAAAVIEIVLAETAVLAPAPPPRSEARQIRQRQCGGWIGIYDDGSLRFGVTAGTEAETAEKLDRSLVRWRAALTPGAHDAPRRDST